jgi:drug/metabolite transporter (DMT)-like permease
VLLASASFAALAASVKAFLRLVGPEVGLGPPVFARGALGLVVCALWARARGSSLRPRNRGALAARCLIGAAAMLCYYTAIGPFDAELATSTMLLKSSPLWVALLSPALLGEPTGRRTWLGVLLGAAGLLALAQALRGAEAPAAGAAGTHRLLGLGLCLLAGLLSAGAYMSLRGLAHTDDAPTVVFAFSAVLALGALPFLAPLGAALGGDAAWSPAAWGLLLVAGAMGTLGQLFLTAAYRFGTAAAVTVGGLSEVGLALLASLLVFGQRPSPLALLGGGLAMLAGIVASGGRRAGPRPNSPSGT